MLQGLYILYLQCPCICWLTLYKGSAHLIYVEVRHISLILFVPKSETKYKMSKQRVLHVYRT